MSSWANRDIPRKRNLSQIPEGLRPIIISRAEHPKVILSESFQKQENEIIYPSGLKDSKALLPDTNLYSRYIPKQTVNFIPSASAITLRHNDKSYVFVILRHIGNTNDNNLWISSYQSIRNFYDNHIIIIDDNSNINTVNGKLINTEIITSEFNGAGEILPYHYFLKYKWADRMIFLHDSMFLNRPFNESELSGLIRFHWHFNNTDISEQSKINTYLSMLHNNDGLLDYAKTNHSWKGCFGGATMIDLEIVEHLEKKYNFFPTLTLSIKSRKDREIFERIFGIIVYYEKMIEEPCSNFGLITQYPNAFESQHTDFSTANHIISQNNYNTAILKVWRGR